MMRSSALGLLAVVLSLMAFGTRTAQAATEEAPEWMVNGSNINLKANTDLLPTVQVKEVEPLKGTTERHLVLLTTIGTSVWEFLCSTDETSGFKLVSHGLTTEGHLHFTGCKFLVSGKENKSCILKSPGKAAGELLTEPVIGKLEFSTKGAPIVSVLPVNAAMLFVTLELGALCPFGEVLEIKGTVALEDFNAESEAEATEHLIQEEPASTKMFFGSNPMILDGSVLTRLSGAHEGMKFSGLWALPVEEEPPEWMIKYENSNLGPDKELTAEVQAKEAQVLKLLTTSGGSTVEITCGAMAFSGAALEPHGAVSKGDAMFTSCKFFLNGKENTNCSPNSSGKSSGSILTETSDGKLGLSAGGEPIVTLLPTNAERLFVKLIFGSGLCPIGESVKITGAFAIADSEGVAKTEALEHRVKEEAGSTELSFGGNSATIDGSVLVHLTGIHGGMPFSGLAG